MSALVIFCFLEKANKSIEIMGLRFFPLKTALSKVPEITHFSWLVGCGRTSKICAIYP